MNLRDNSLSKKIPNFISNLSNITSLSLSNKKYTGSIPSSMQKLVRLETLQLENNLLSGKIPSWLFNIKGMKHLFLGGNNLISNSDAKIEPTCVLSQLCMKSCGLAGEITYWISKLKTLDFLDLSENKLEGIFPQWLAEMKVGSIIMLDNNLTGSLPPCLFNSKSLPILSLS